MMTIIFGLPYTTTMNRKRVAHPIPSLVSIALPLLLATSARAQSTDHSCGAPNVHNPAVTYAQATDIDGNAYRTVVIDDKVWFAENLKVTRFQNGDAIPQVSDSASWSTLTGPGMCSYRNDTTFDCPYGKLYNHHVARDPRNPCPAGWRVPSMTDLYDLIFFLDPDANAQQPGNQPNTAGGRLKSAGLAYYRPPNAGATNSSGFSAIPNGGRNPQGQFSLSYDAAAGYWLSTEVGPGMGFFLELAYPQDWAVRNAYFSGYGVCIRCVIDLADVNVEENGTGMINVSPNPTVDGVTVSLAPSMLGQAYQVHDMTGRLVASGRVVAERTPISLVHAPMGMYTLRISGMEGRSFRVVKE